jgi:hypothetical protein
MRDMAQTILTEKRPKSASSRRQLLRHQKRLEESDYNRILDYLNETEEDLWLSWTAVPYPRFSLVLTTVADHLDQFQHDGHTFSCYRSHPGNSAVQFYRDGRSTIHSGFIDAIWRMNVNGDTHTFLRIETFRKLQDRDIKKAPFHQYRRFQTHVADAQPSGERVIIEPKMLISHVVVCKRPKWTYGIAREILVINTALNRGRR